MNTDGYETKSTSRRSFLKASAIGGSFAILGSRLGNAVPIRPDIPIVKAQADGTRRGKKRQCPGM